MSFVLILWIVSLVGIVGTVSLRAWQIKTNRINPAAFDPEHENPLALAKVEAITRAFLIALRDQIRTFFIRFLHTTALFAHKVRVKLDTLVHKMLARIEHEKGALEANRTSEQFLNSISEYKDTLRNAAKEMQTEVEKTVQDAGRTVHTVTETVTEAIKKPARRKRTVHVASVMETKTENPTTTEPVSNSPENIVE